MVAQNNYACTCSTCSWWWEFREEQDIINEFISRRGRNPTPEEIDTKKDIVQSCVRLVGMVTSITEQEFKDLIYHEFIHPSNLAWFEEDYDQLSAEEKQDIATFTRYLGEAISTYLDMYLDC